MCGITGAIWGEQGQPLTEQELSRMTEVLAHRGPDEAGRRWFAGGAFGFRRLSIIDLAGGHQPMTASNGRYHIVFNGEIYNYRELRRELRQRGHSFATESDTEVLLACYQEYGTACVDRLRGMFAFAIWDGQRLFLARDRLGQKPLYYRREGGRLLFASELKSLLQVDDAPRELDPPAFDDFLTYQYVPHPACIFRGYSKLAPGHAAIYQSGHLTLVRYWSPPYQAVDQDESPALTLDPAEVARWTPRQWQTELRRRLTEAVRLRLRSDVPLGAFLSGGIDSTIIVGLMQEILRAEGGPAANTFSIGFGEKAYDERRYARMAAEHLGTDHHERIVDPDALAILPRLIDHYDEPFADSSAIPTMILSEFTQSQVTVALSGDGGDELFCGYDRYQAVRLAGKIAALPGPLRAALASRLWQRLPGSGRQRSLPRRIKRFTAALADSPERQYLRWIGTFESEARRRLYTPDFHKSLDGHDSVHFLAEAFQACRNRDFLTRTTCADLLTYLPCDILTKVDIASMATGLEVRSPFLDHHVVELAAAMPMELKQARGRGKRILVETFADLIPAPIQRRAKMGFGVPIGPWFRRELYEFVRETLLSERTLSRGVYRGEELTRLLEEHRSGAWDHGYRLWTLLVGELWMRQWLDKPMPPGATTAPRASRPA